MTESDPRDLLYPDDEESTAIVRLDKLSRTPSVPPRDRRVLVQVQGEDLGRIVDLAGAALLVGRQQACDLPLADNSVSRQHARIRFVEGKHVLEDLGSANGTFVGGNRVTTHVLRDGDVVQFGSAIAYRYSVIDSQQLEMLKHLYDTSVTDALTSAFNREYFDSRLATEIAYSRRHSSELSLLMVDVDHFKRVNDTYGHQAGDQVLVRLVETVRTKLRVEDVFCRYGGEEFAAILRTTDLAAAACAAERVRDAIERTVVDTGEQRIRITVSIGCASLSCIGNPTAAELVRIADNRLYAAKRAGRNRVVAASV